MTRHIWCNILHYTYLPLQVQGIEVKREKRLGGGCWKLILFTLQCSLQYVICLLWYRGELLICLIDNMLDGKLWLFPGRQEKEGEISSPVFFDLQTLPISSESVQMSLIDIYCNFFFFFCEGNNTHTVVRVCEEGNNCVWQSVEEHTVFTRSIPSLVFSYQVFRFLGAKVTFLLWSYHYITHTHTHTRTHTHISIIFLPLAWFFKLHLGFIMFFFPSTPTSLPSSCLYSPYRYVR